MHTGRVAEKTKDPKTGKKRRKTENTTILGKFRRNIMAKKTPMTTDATSRIQSHADKTGTNQDFKARAQSAASKNKK
jgi:hypothetical protein